MDYEFTPKQSALREELRRLIQDEMPANFPGIFVEEREPFEATQRFNRLLGESGLLTMSWPGEYGGRDATLWEQAVFREEMWAHNEPRGPQYMGLNWVGPAVMAYGSDRQKQQHLPRIASGEVVWCQGFSEPNAGSDLASLRTRAGRDGAGWLINGQKIWTSYAGEAQWCFLATRTSSEGPKQHGITVFLIPLDRAGVEVRPIESMLGPRHFNEVFLTDVRATDDDVLGEVDQGWAILTAGLAFERTGVARYARALRQLTEVKHELGDAWETAGELRGRIAIARVHSLVANLLSYRVVSIFLEGAEAPPRREASIARAASTVLDQEVSDIAMDALAPLALLDHNDPGSPVGGHMEHHWRYAQAATVAAGTLEVQKMLIARDSL